MTDFLVDRTIDDLIECSWVPTPLSIEERNSTVAKNTHTQEKRLTINIENCCTRKDTSKKTVLTKFEMNSGCWVFVTKAGWGFRRLRLFNYPGVFYQHKPDRGTVSAVPCDRTFAFLILSERRAIWWFLHDHIFRLTVQFTMLLTYSDKQCFFLGGRSPSFWLYNLTSKVSLLIFNIQEVFQRILLLFLEDIQVKCLYCNQMVILKHLQEKRSDCIFKFIYRDGDWHIRMRVWLVCATLNPGTQSASQRQHPVLSQLQ